MTPKSRKGLPLLTMFSTFCSFDAGFPHLCAVKARKRGCGPHKYPQHDHCIQCILDLQKSQLAGGRQKRKNLSVHVPAYGSLWKKPNTMFIFVPVDSAVG